MDLTSYFTETVNGISEKLKEKKTGRRLLAYQVARLGKRVFERKDPLVWVNVTVPFEIVNCFPVVSIYSEFVGAVLSGAQMAAPYLEKAEAAGYPTDLCSYHRALLGASLGELLPQPVGALSATVPCDGGVKGVGEIAHLSKVPMLTLNVPETATDEGVKYLAGKLEESTRFLAEVSGAPFDKELLRTNIEKSNKTAEILKRVYAFSGQVPAPLTHKDLKNFQIVMLPLLGTDEGIEIGETFEKEFTDRVKNKTGGIENEKIRLLWIQNRIQFPNELLDHIAVNYGANIVWDELNEIYWDPIDPDDPFIGLAKRLIQSPLGGDFPLRLSTLANRSKQYSIHGAIHPCHWGCRQSLNARKLFAKALEDVGVPMMTLDVDCVDQRSFSPGQLLTRLEAFCEMLKENG